MEAEHAKPHRVATWRSAFFVKGVSPWMLFVGTRRSKQLVNTSAE
jgi:hypothetical protein